MHGCENRFLSTTAACLRIVLAWCKNYVWWWWVRPIKEIRRPKGDCVFPFGSVPAGGVGQDGLVKRFGHGLGRELVVVCGWSRLGSVGISAILAAGGGTDGKKA